MTENVETYYDETYKSYVRGWSSSHFHMGIWDNGVKSHEDSLVRTVEEVANSLNLSSDDIVLDAGCGVGGSSVYLAQKYGCKVIGIANSHVLIDAANEKLKNFSNLDLSFQYMDFNNTTFEDSTFTAIFGLESVSHSVDKEQFTKEAYRLLQPGGRLLISDGYLTTNDIDGEEKMMYDEFLDGWALPYLETPEKFQQIMTEIGFSKVTYEEITDDVAISLNRMYRNARFSRFLYYILSKIGLATEKQYKSAKSAYLLKKCVDEGITEYGFLYGEKAKTE